MSIHPVLPRSILALVLSMISIPVPSLAGSPPTSPPLDPQAAEIHWRQVGFMPTQGNPCPSPSSSSGWRTPIQVDAGGERYCIYEFGNVVTPADITALDAAVGLPELAPDRMATRPSGAIDDILRSRQSQRFLEQVGQVFLPAPPAALGSDIHLGLLDTQPSSLPGEMPMVDENSVHGRTLRRFADFLLCQGQQPCPVSIHSRLSLSHTDFHPFDPELSPRDAVHGGLFGTIAELGEQLVAEVADWTATSTMGARLVLNLSVAWDGALFGGLETGISGLPDPAAMPVDVRLVFRALEDAADAGILVIAAAGNRVDHRQAEGALLPAAWERAQAPLPTGGSSATYRPLVHAVAGVDSAGADLVLSQPGSRSPLLAYADHAVVANDGMGPTDLLTGSSVASLVVSVAAAAAWSYAPGLDAWELVDRLYLSGDGLGGPPELCLPDAAIEPCASARPVARRISICRAVEQVCAETGGCPAPFDVGTGPSPCEPWSPSAPDLDGVDWAPFVPMGVTFYGSPETLVPGEPCTGPLLAPTLDAPGDPCPTRQYDGVAATPWVRPQPGSNPCPNCPIKTGTLRIEVAEDFDGTLTAPTLLACGTSIALDLPMLSATDTWRVDGVPVPTGCSLGLLTFAAPDADGGAPGSTVSAVVISE